MRNLSIPTITGFLLIVTKSLFWHPFLDKYNLSGIGILGIQLKRSWEHYITGLLRRHVYVETAPRTVKRFLYHVPNYKLAGQKSTNSADGIRRVCTMETEMSFGSCHVDNLWCSQFPCSEVITNGRWKFKFYPYVSCMIVYRHVVVEWP